MLKTIKIKKQMRLDELIKYVWDNRVNEKRVFLGNHEQRVVFDNVGGFYPSGYAYSPDTTFTVEIEEPITEYTRLDGVQEIFIDKEEQRIRLENFEWYSINDILDEHDKHTECLQIYALIDGKLQLVWERDE